MSQVNYIELLGEYYPDISAVCSGSAYDYNNITFEGDVILQAELDTVHLVKIKTNKIIEFSEYARAEVTAGFVSSALGFPHKYDSEPEDQLNLIGAVTADTDVLYSSWPSARGCHDVEFTTQIDGTEATGLANDNTQYLAEIKFSGTSTYLSIAGQNAQTLNDLVIQINADADFSTYGEAMIQDGKLMIESKNYSATSTVQIIDSTLFMSLSGFTGYSPMVTGSDPGDLPKEYKNHTHAQLLTVLNDGKTVKLTALQKFAVKRAQIEAATSEVEIDAVTWS